MFWVILQKRMITDSLGNVLINESLYPADTLSNQDTETQKYFRFNGEDKISFH